MYNTTKVPATGKNVALDVKNAYLKGYRANKFHPYDRSIYLAEEMGIRVRFSNLSTVNSNFNVESRIVGIFNYDNDNIFGGYSPEINILVDDQFPKKDIAKTVYYLTGCYMFGTSFPSIINKKHAFFAFKLIDDSWYEGKMDAMEKFANEFSKKIS
jgi:hypothetical protein